jgi:hypothetical protein
MAAALFSPFESHRRRILAATENDEHVSSLIHCDWPSSRTAQEPPLSRAATPHLAAWTLSSTAEDAAYSEMLEARRLARAAKQDAQLRLAATPVVTDTMSSDDSLDVLIDAILAIDGGDQADSTESRVAWRR